MAHISKSISFPPKDKRWIDRFAKDAKNNGRSFSAHLIFIIRDYFERSEMILAINKGGKD